MKIIYITNGVKDIRNKTQYQHSEMLIQNYTVVTISRSNVAPFVADDSQAVYCFSEYPGPQFLFPYWAIVVTMYYMLTGYETVYTTHNPQCLVLGIFGILPGVNWIADIWDDPRLGRQISQFNKSNKSQLLPDIPYSQVLIFSSIRLLKYCDLIVLSISKEIIDEWPVNITEDQILATTNGVDIKYTRSVVSEMSVGNLDNSETLEVLYIGHTARSRGLETIIDTAVQLSEAQNQNYRISLVGPIGKTDRHWLENKLTQYNIEYMINIHGQVTHKHALTKLAESDICLNILPQAVKNYNYAFPIKIFEYMCLGKPIISTQTIGTEKILSDGSTAMLLPENEPNLLVERIIELSNDQDLRREIGANAMEKINDYDWSTIRSNILERISQL